MIVTDEDEFEVHTSERMEDLCKEHEWEVQVIPDLSEFEISENVNDIIWKLYAKRDYDSLIVTWRGNSQVEATHKDKKGVHPLHWRGAVVKVIEARRVQHNVPFNKDDDSAYDIMLALYRKKITFVRSVDGQEDEIFVDVDLKQKASAKLYKLKETSTGRRVIEWADAHGFHAVGLDQIIDVT